MNDKIKPNLNSTSIEHAKTVKYVSKVALVVNLALCIIKITSGFFGESQAVIADGFHSLTDTATDIILIFAASYWALPPDQSHPYGHKKYETIVTLIVGIILGLTAFAMIFDAIESIKTPDNTSVGQIALYAALISIFTKEALFQYTKKYADKISSNALKANALHQRSDAISSIPVAASVALVYFWPTVHFLDSIAAIAVSLFILFIAYKIVQPTLSELTDKGASAKKVEEIKLIAKNVDGVKEVHKVRTRLVSASIFVDMHVLVSPTLTIDQGHDIATNVQNQIHTLDNEIADVVIHIEPFKNN